MRLPRRVTAALGSLLLLPLLASCGEDPEQVETGDIVPAREDAQFADGTESTIALPLGELEVLVGEPADSLSAEETRQLEAIDAPEGTSFVPITWQYDSGTFGDYDDYLLSDATPVIDLVSRGASYRLPAPEASGSGSESFYVLVDGRGEDASLEVEFDGVTQTVDLRTGKREADRAKPLYRLKPRSERTRACTPFATFGTGEDDAPRRAPDYSCTVTRTARLPYAAGAWAEPGRSWLVVTAKTSLRRYDRIAADFKSGAIYFAGSVESEFRLGRMKPAEVIVDRERTACPDPARGGCVTTYHLVFDVPEDPPMRLRIKQVYDMVLTSVWGGGEGKDLIELPVSVTMRLR
ncbi:hypothetical protein [Nocardioides sp. SYSU DS0651]|uniref:hypothetical protein n=1 Tax=Nocardioides sp. SYSU DS0651 TaxID=3415955 RepID=UPI003F4BAE9E